MCANIVTALCLMCVKAVDNHVIKWEKGNSVPIMCKKFMTDMYLHLLEFFSDTKLNTLTNSTETLLLILNAVLFRCFNVMFSRGNFRGSLFGVRRALRTRTFDWRRIV